MWAVTLILTLILILAVILTLIFFGMALTVTPMTVEELITLKETCPGKELCVPNQSTDVRTANCVCDADCYIYGDCCRNSPLFKPKDTFSSPFSCVNAATGQASYYMISKCPPETNANLRRSCEDPKPSEDPFVDNLPVSFLSSDSKTITYRNIHCAICHGVKYLPSGKVWNATLHCMDHKIPDRHPKRTDVKLRWNNTRRQWTVILNGQKVLEKCDIGFEYKGSMELRLCRRDGYVDTCLNRWKGTREERFCRSYTAFVAANQTTFRNVYCAKCNDLDVDEVACVDLSMRSYSHSPVPPFTMLLRNPELKTVCGKDEIYDDIFEVCRNVLCPPKEMECTVTKGTTVRKELNTNTSQIDSCKRVALEKTTVQLSRDNRSVWVEKFNRNFTQGEFLIRESGQMEICTADIPKKTDKYSVVMGIITVVGLGISIFFLLMHLCAVVFVAELRNHSGMNLSSLCMALLGAYISFIVGAFLVDISPKGCFTIAVLIYYFFMSAFFWMFAIAFDVWRVLRGAVRQFRISHGQQWCRFFTYSIFAWGLPVLLTITTVFINNAPPGKINDELRPHFGEEVCWFSKQLSLVVFFAVPLAVVMVLNVIFFTSSAYMASKTRSASVPANVSGHRRDFRLYLRLAVLLGLTWVVGLLAAVTDYELLWISFVLLNTLQGLFIFIMFTCTSKVVDAITTQRPWTNRLRKSFKLPPTKNIAMTPSLDAGLSQSTSQSTLQSSSNTTKDVHTQNKSSPSSTHLEVESLPRRPFS